MSVCGTFTIQSVVNFRLRDNRPSVQGGDGTTAVITYQVSSLSKSSKYQKLEIFSNFVRERKRENGIWDESDSDVIMQQVDESGEGGGREREREREGRGGRGTKEREGERERREGGGGRERETDRLLH